MTILDVAGLTVRFGGVVAVDRVDFSVDEGRILGLVGPNGAGKTTIFDALCGFVPSSGRVTLAGRDISGMSPEARSKARLGRSFQDARMFPSLTVTEALKVAFERHIRAHGVVSSALSLPWVYRTEKRISRRVDELIDLMGLGAFRDKFISELSTGSRRIVDLAAIIAHDPVVLLLDEPSSGIAQREAEALGPLLLKIRKDTSTTMLIVEHDMPLLRSVSDEVLALETGQVLTQGKPDEVLSDPRLIAAYLGTDQAVVARSGAQVPATAPTKPATPTATSTRKPQKATARKAAVKKAAAPAAVGTGSPAPSPARKRAPRTTTAVTKKTPVKKAAPNKAAKKTTALTKKTAAATPRRATRLADPPHGTNGTNGTATPAPRARKDPERAATGS